MLLAFFLRALIRSMMSDAVWYDKYATRDLQLIIFLKIATFLQIR